MNKINPFEVIISLLATVLMAWGMVSLVYKWLEHSETEFKAVAVQHQAENTAPPITAHPRLCLHCPCGQSGD